MHTAHWSPHGTCGSDLCCAPQSGCFSACFGNDVWFRWRSLCGSRSLSPRGRDLQSAGSPKLRTRWKNGEPAKIQTTKSQRHNFLYYSMRMALDYCSYSGAHSCSANVMGVKVNSNKSVALKTISNINVWMYVENFSYADNKRFFTCKKTAESLW